MLKSRPPGFEINRESWQKLSCGNLSWVTPNFKSAFIKDMPDNQSFTLNLVRISSIEYSKNAISRRFQALL